MLVYSLAMFSCVLVFALFINMQAYTIYDAVVVWDGEWLRFVWDGI